MTKTNRQQGPRRFEAAGLTHLGQVRDNNEDQFVLADLGRSMLVQTSSLGIADDARVPAPGKAHLILVADGMGGLPDGEAASTAAAGEASRYALENLPCFSHGVPDDELREELGGLVRNCEAAVRALVQADPARSGAGTTLTLGYIQHDRLHVAHVGDSRCYVLRGDRLTQVTTDHTLARQMHDQGLVAPGDALHLGYDHVLWNVLGGGDQDAEPDLIAVDLGDVDAVLFCTDGLSRHVDDAQIARVLGRADDAQSACRALVDEANSRGGSDNITVVVAYLNHPSAAIVQAETAEDAAEQAASRRQGVPRFVHRRLDRGREAAPGGAFPVPLREQRHPVCGWPMTGSGVA